MSFTKGQRVTVENTHHGIVAVSTVEAIGKRTLRIAGSSEDRTFTLEGIQANVVGSKITTYSGKRIRPWQSGDDEAAEAFALARLICTACTWEKVRAYPLDTLRALAAVLPLGVN